MNAQTTHITCIPTTNTVEPQLVSPEACQQARGDKSGSRHSTANILYPTRTRRLMSEVAGVRRYHRSSDRAIAAARGGVLWVAVGKGWSCNPELVANFLAIVERQIRRS